MKRYLGLFVICATSLLLTFSQAHGQALNPFVGSWSGETQGDISGKQEKLRCTANSKMTEGGLKLSVRCAGSAAAIRISASVRESNGKLSGVWQEALYGINGTVSGTISGNTINGRIASPNYTAAFTINRTSTGINIAVTPSSGALRVNVAMR